jgi:hypothetical protein
MKMDRMQVFVYRAKKPYRRGIGKYEAEISADDLQENDNLYSALYNFLHQVCQERGYAGAELLGVTFVPIFMPNNPTNQGEKR